MAATRWPGVLALCFPQPQESIEAPEELEKVLAISPEEGENSVLPHLQSAGNVRQQIKCHRCLRPFRGPDARTLVDRHIGYLRESNRRVPTRRDSETRSLQARSYTGSARRSD